MAKLYHVGEFEKALDQFTYTKRKEAAMAVKSAERVLDIFEFLSCYPNGLTGKEVSSKLSWAGSSTFELLKTLTDRGYLTADENRRYRLSAKLVNLGMNVMPMTEIGRITAPYARRAMEALEETIFIAVRIGAEIAYVGKAESNHTLATRATVGSRKPLYCTGLGKALLAFMDTERRKPLIAQLSFIRFTDQTIMSAAELEAQLEQFRRQGYAVDDGEIEEGLYCLAFPIYDGKSKLIAAVSVAGPKSRMLRKETHCIEVMKKTALIISKRCGYES